MSQTVILIGKSQRDFAKRLIDTAPANGVVTIREATRSGEQNAKLWAMLSDISRAKPDGRRWTPETWKAAFMHTLGHQVQFCEGLDNSGPFPLGFRSSRLSVKQMADLITVIQEYGDRHGITWTGPEDQQTPAGGPPTMVAGQAGEALPSSRQPSIRGR